MKTIISIICLALFVQVSAVAQDNNNERYEVTNKKGQNILPEAGDFAIGIDASPIFYYLGNMFNNNSDNGAPSITGHRYNIYGKYFLRDRQAVRFGVSVNTGTDLYKSLVPDDSQPITDPNNDQKTVVDVWKHQYTNVEFAAGYEFRRGYKRLQAFYGAELIFGVKSGRSNYEYANAFTELNPYPSTTNFGNNISEDIARVTSVEGGSEYDLGLGLFIGAEYFFAPKMSISGELGFRAGYGFFTQRLTNLEFFDEALGGVQTVEIRSRVEDSFSNRGAFWSRPSGSLALTFYF